MNKRIVFLLLSVIALGALGYWYNNKPKGNIKADQANFAVKDTGSIQKIFIADNEGKTILLSRTEEGWMLNDSIKARKDAVYLILETLPNIKLKAPISRRSIEHMIKRISVNHKKVEIYMEGDEDIPTKTIYISDATKDHYGNLALLETKEYGRAEIPYFIHKQGQKGFLSPIFFTKLLDWVHTSVFEYQDFNEISKIRVDHYDQPEESFELAINNSKMEIKGVETNIILNGYDTLLVQDYVRNYKKVFYEIDDYLLTDQQKDSILKSKPWYRIQVIEDSGDKNEIVLYKKSEPVRTIDFEEEQQQLLYDRDRLYGYYQGRFILCQHNTFDKLTYGLSDFRTTN